MSYWWRRFRGSGDTLSDVLRAVEAARAAQADLIVSVGGGSVTDATKIVALANSVAYNVSGRSFTSVREAVQRIGLSTLKTLSVSVVMKQMAAGAAAERSAAASLLWDHSVHVAALAFENDKAVAEAE